MFLPFSRQAKAWEPKALELRRLAGVERDALLDPWALAPKVGLLVVDATNELLESIQESSRSRLLGSGRNSWSGGVLPTILPDGKRICILNPTHSRGRCKSTLMEEIAHVFLGHDPTRMVFEKSDLRVRDFNKELEKEAFGVGVAALLPWSSFYHRINEGKNRLEISEEYQVTEELVRYRIQIGGAIRLFNARQRAA